jgi:hypothetical protein
MARKKKGDIAQVQDPDGNIFEGDENLEKVHKGEVVEEPDYPLASPETDALRDKIKDLTQNISNSYWELSLLVHQVHANKLYKTWGYKEFPEWTAAELGFQKRKAHYLVQFQEYCGKRLPQVLPPAETLSAIDQLKTIGWSKALEIAKENVITQENYVEVLSHAQTDKIDEFISRLKLIKSEMKEEDKEDSNETNTMKTFRKSFIMTTSQEEIITSAIEKAKKAINKDKTSDTVALEYICNDFEANGEVDPADIFSKLERIFGCSIIAITDDGQRILFGSDTLSRLSGSQPDTDTQELVETVEMEKMQAPIAEEIYSEQTGIAFGDIPLAEG